ncbi:MAG: amidohydrolase family protein [Thermodesulfobacteriota bacterium]
MTTAFVNGRVFVGDGNVLDHATVLVEGDRIIKVEKGKSSVPRNAEKISLDGVTLFPGFIDCHVHLCLDGSPDPVATLMKEPVQITTIKASLHAFKTLMNGVTTVRDMGGKESIDICLRDAIRSGMIPGPRMLVSRRMVCMTGGHGWHFGREADGPDEVRKAAREQIRGGADLVKFMATGGVMTPGVEPGGAQLTEEELRAGIEEAHKANRKTATHAMGTQGILNALRAGIDSIEHGVYMNEEAISIMKKKDVFFIPTLSALFHIDNKGIEAGIPAYAVEKTRQVKPHHLNSIRLAREAGVLTAAGTDAGTPFNEHGRNLEEILFLAGQGYTPLDALRAGTSIAAKLLGVEKDFGTVETGKTADLVVVKGNPLETIEALPTSVAVVMQGGKVVRNDL